MEKKVFEIFAISKFHNIAAKLNNCLYPSLAVYKYLIRGYEDTIKP